MLTRNYLLLRLVRLKAAEQWLESNEGLCFVLAREGAGTWASGQGTRRLVGGDVLVLAQPGSVQLSAAPDKELAFSVFCIALENLFPLFAANEISLMQEVAQPFKFGRHFSASTPVAAECHRLISGMPPQFDLEHRSQLLRVAAAVLAGEFKTARAQRAGFGTTEEHMTHVFESLSGEELVSLSVGDLAEKFRCSRRHLNRLFQQHFGTSAAALRMEIRMLKAASLLRDPAAKVIRIAEACGFNHLGLFNTVFKRRFGASPGAWRKKQTRLAGAASASRDQVLPCVLRNMGLCPWPGSPSGSRPQIPPSGRSAQPDWRIGAPDSTSNPHTYCA